MSRPTSPHTTSAETRGWSHTKARVLAYCELELRRRGVAFVRLNAIPSSRPDYDALVEVWQDRGAHMVGVRLPAEADVATLPAPVPAAPAAA